MNTHETFIHGVMALAKRRLSKADLEALEGIKLVYGSGPSGTRGVTYFGKWKAGQEARPFVEVSAFGQESWVQVAGTTLHELGHVLAGGEAGHGKDWHAACERLGLRKIRAAGARYCLANFDPELRTQIAALTKPDEGEPVSNLMTQPVSNLMTRGGLWGGLPGGLPGGMINPKPCGAGIGTRGGKSRGKGSGSRMRKYVCEHCGQIIRAATDSLAATHTPDGGAFQVS